MVLRTAHVLNSLETGLTSKQPSTRAGAFLLITAISEICKSPVEPYLIPLVPSILDGAADKVPEVHTAAVRAGRAVVNNMCPFGARFVLPRITEAMASTARWQQKNAACVLLNDILSRAPSASAPSLPLFFAPLRELMTDAREEVREAALAAMQVALTLVNNRDLEPLLPVRSSKSLCIPAIC
jgi:elongation factor 3